MFCPGSPAPIGGREGGSGLGQTGASDRLGSFVQTGVPYRRPVDEPFGIFDEVELLTCHGPIITTGCDNRVRAPPGSR